MSTLDKYTTQTKKSADPEKEKDKIVLEDKDYAVLEMLAELGAEYRRIKRL